MKKQRGVALILVLTMLSVLIGISANYILSVSRETESIDLINNRTQARYSAFAGIQYAQFAMQDPNKEIRWTTDGKLFTTELAGGVIYVQITPESGRIDINRASPELLALLFEYAGVTSEQAQQLVDNVRHWRNSKDLQVGQSVFDADYEAAGEALPAHREFYAIEEITQVLGVNLSIYSKIKSLITVFGNSRVNLLSAADETLKVLLLTDEDIMTIHNAREDYYDNETQIPSTLLQLSPFLTFRMRDNYYRVLSYAVAENGTSESVFSIIKNRRNSQGMLQEMQRGLLSDKERTTFIQRIKQAQQEDN